MLGNGAAVAIALLLASTEQSESDPLTMLLKQVEQFVHPGTWKILFIGFALLVFLLSIGDQLSGILSWLGVPSPFQRKQTPISQLELTRQKLLKIVKKEVNRRLATSLHNLVKLDLYMEDQRQRVGNRKLELVPEDPPKDNEPSFQSVNRVLHPKGNKPPLDLKLTQKIIEVFERPDIQGKLLILGEPGSGKTTELLQLAKDLVTRVEEDDQHPVPVILELSSWNGESVDKWVASQLKKFYSISAKTTQQWLTGNQILLMLDGLDELGLTKQRHCIEKINQFLETTHTPEIVVCCRREEYEAGQIELDGLNGAIYLEALKEDQIRQYFEALNRLSLWSHVSGNPTLLELAQKPLFLFMLVVAYQGNPIRNQRELFDAYIEKQLHDPKNQGTYRPGKEPTAQQTRHYLVWLAKELKHVSGKEFLIEGLQPTWLSSTARIRLYVLLVKLLIGLIHGLTSVLLIWVFTGELFTGLVVGLIVGLRSELSGLVIELTEQVQWSSHLGIRIGVRNGLRGGLIFGLLGVFIGEAVIDGLLGGLIGTLMLGLMFGLMFGLTGGLINVPIKEKAEPNQGIKKNLQNVLYLGLIFGLIFGLVFGLIFGLVFGLIFGLVFGLIGGRIGMSNGGLEAAIKHFILRILLTKNGDTPWNYARFLDHAVKHRFIQRTGGRYRFVHDLLRKHFAAMPLE